VFEVVPRLAICFHSMRPSPLSSQISCTAAISYWTAVSSSWMVHQEPAVALSPTTRRSGWTSFAAIAPGRAMPIEQNPLEMMQVFGS
jgi:hypothetical protein